MLGITSKYDVTMSIDQRHNRLGHVSLRTNKKIIRKKEKKTKLKNY